MKKVLFIIAVFIFIVNYVNADTITGCKINSIQHPGLDYSFNKPLIIDYQIEWNKQEIDRRKIVCNPMLYKKIYIRNNEEKMEYKESNIIYYDVYKRPDNKGFILFKKETMYDCNSQFQEIFVYDLLKDKSIRLEPHGYDMYFSEDKKYLITTLYNNNEGEKIDNITLFYYDLSDAIKKPAKQTEMKYEEFLKLNLKSPKK
ncbi:MAG: hypothetical protein WC947_00140 [Elusimicrobiota bacterium]